MLTYKDRNKGTKYYKEFWARREKEKNDSAVFIIVSDIQYSYKTKMTSGILQLQADNSKLNDTLKSLLEIEYRYDTLTNELARKDSPSARYWLCLGFPYKYIAVLVAFISVEKMSTYGKSMTTPKT